MIDTSTSEKISAIKYLYSINIKRELVRNFKSPENLDVHHKFYSSTDSKGLFSFSIHFLHQMFKLNKILVLLLIERNLSVSQAFPN